MSVTLSIAFGLVALGSIAVIWQTLADNAVDIIGLHRQVTAGRYGDDVIVTFRDSPIELDAMSSVRRPRQVRVPAPKPVTHRLHQFAKARTAA